MNTTQTSRESYEQQLQRIARAMSTARSADVYDDLEAGSRPELLKEFVDGNLDKRLEKLDKGLEFVKEAIGEPFEELAVEFIKALPLGAYDSGQYDGEKFLVWLVENKPLTPEQRDHVACQRARHAIENLGRNQRLAHVRFQELASLADDLASELQTNPGLQIHLNPIRVWTQFETGELLGEEIDSPIDVLFFAVRNEISTAVLEENGRNLVEELSTLTPVSIATWTALSEHADREELVELCRDLAEMGLVAFS